ncbi:MAG: DNA-processing protein DprA, partial [Anaerolineales bacterium]
MNEKPYWVGFNLVKSIGAVRLQGLRDHFGDLALAWQAPRDALMAAGLSGKLAERVVQVRSDVDLEKYLERVNNRGIEILTWDDVQYPPHLKEIDQPPPVLYLRGTLKSDDN